LDHFKKFLLNLWKRFPENLSTVSSALTTQKPLLVTLLTESTCLKHTFPEKGFGGLRTSELRDQA